jgi:hypothetical protein
MKEYYICYSYSGSRWIEAVVPYYQIRCELESLFNAGAVISRVNVW